MKELFENGFSYRSFMLNQPKETRTKLMNNYIPMEVSYKQRALVNAITKKVKILGVVEGSCTDTQLYLPVLEKLISTNNNIELKLLTKSYIKNELENYEVNGDLKTPTFIFMNEDNIVKGTFIEKPSKGDDMMESAAEELTQILTDVYKQ